MPQSCYMQSSPVTHPPCAFLTWNEPYSLTLDSKYLWNQAHISHNSNTTALSGRTSSQLAIYPMNTKISLISDFTSRLIDRLSLTPLPARAGARLGVHTPGWAGNAALCPLLSSNVSSNESYANHQMPKDKYNSFSAWGVFFSSRQKGMIIMSY